MKEKRVSSITPHYRTVTQLLQNRSFSIDEYQREYKWSQQNIEELVTDLQGKFDSAYRAGDSPKAASEYPDYFLGSIIVTKRAGKNFLVDGQQRVTDFLGQKAAAVEAPPEFVGGVFC